MDDNNNDILFVEGGAMIDKFAKLTMQKLVELKDKKVWNSIFFKCYICKEIKPIATGSLVETDPTTYNYGESTLVSQVCEVVCEPCIETFYNASLEIVMGKQP